MYHTYEGISSLMLRQEQPDIIASTTRLDHSLIKTSEVIEELNSTLLLFAQNQQQQYTLPVLFHGAVTEPNTERVITTQSTHTEYSRRYTDGTAMQPPVAENEHEPPAKSITEKIKDVADIADAAGGIAKFIGRTMPRMKVAGEIFESMGNVAKVAVGAGELVSAAEGAGIITGLMGAAGMLTGTTAIAEVLAGPIGWALLAGTALTGAGLQYMANEETEKQQKKKEKRDASNIPLNTFRMPAKDMNQYTCNLIQEGRSIKVKQSKPYSELAKVENTIRKEYGIHALDPAILSLVSVNDMGNNTPFSPAKWKTDKEQTKAPATFAQRNPDTQLRLKSAASKGGIKRFHDTYLQVIEEAAKYDLLHHTNTRREKELVAMQTFHQIGFAQNMDNKPITEKYTRHNTRKTTGRKIARGGGSIIINLNGPMIQSFTLHTQSLNSMGGDIKQKVEEALIDILYSANVI